MTDAGSINPLGAAGGRENLILTFPEAQFLNAWFLSGTQEGTEL